MANCEAAHAEYDRLANGALQVGTLPKWMRVQGKVAWYVAQGPYSGLPEAWQKFHHGLGAARAGRPDGPAGDVYVCDPDDHRTDGGRQLLTILYLPIA
ncbi:MAG TPA: hypothetical protein VJQ43_06465 [Thermoplasmata archaeon]|nr:hypothetical protein [Thermoplasmata archaeon]